MASPKGRRRKHIKNIGKRERLKNEGRREKEEKYKKKE